MNVLIIVIITIISILFLLNFFEKKVLYTCLSSLDACVDTINAYYEKFFKPRVSGIHYSSCDDLDVTHTLTQTVC